MILMMKLGVVVDGGVVIKDDNDVVESCCFWNFSGFL